MSVIALSTRAHRPGRPDRAGSPLRTPTLTITLDLAAAAATPGLDRLVDVLDELAASGARVLRPEGHEATRTVPDPRPAPRVAPVEEPATVRILAGTRVVRRGDERIPLTRIEYDLLLFLVEHPRQVFTRRQLLANVWGYEHPVARTVDVHVRRLRAKLGSGGPLVTTVYGVGYRLADEARIVVDHES
ncbi:winged helix-turn-helix domain-containing protein [Micromonospora sp. NPDC048999]|uniref:winged helix-turn-helix domain-containing protein n=1 Tax=Micromonospora sp. NPDC048999 TaxID=3155391 RepID=UPI00340B863D